MAGFEFQKGMERTTLGIWAWNHVFAIKQTDGSKIAVSLIDSQGTFDNSTTFADCSTIFAMNCLFSSVMCFNVFNDLQEDKLNDLAAFVDFAQRINDDLGGNGKLFQDFVFLVRNCQFGEFVESENGGHEYLEKVLGPCDVQKLQELRDSLNSSFERKHCFVFPHPGKKVAYQNSFSCADMDPLFLENVRSTVETLFCKLSIRKKKIGTTVIRCKDLPEYISSCINSFKENRQFAPKAVQILNKSFMLNLEKHEAQAEYESLMLESIEEYPSGCSEDILHKINDANCAKVEISILKRIKNEAISTIVMNGFNESRENVFQKFVNDNLALLEREDERLRHMEELEQQKAEYQEKLERLADQNHRENNKMQLQKYSNTQAEKKQSGADELIGVIKDISDSVKVASEIYHAFFPDPVNDKKTDDDVGNFKKDVEIEIAKCEAGIKIDKAFVKTHRGFPCCIYYNQGHWVTDVTLFYQTVGSKVYQLEERFFYSDKANKFFKELKEVLKQSSDINATWCKTVETYK